MSNNIDHLPSPEDIISSQIENLPVTQESMSSKERMRENARDALAGAKEGLTLGTSAEIGGAEQAILDFIQSQGHKWFPSLVDESPTQIAEKLKKAGFIGDIGPTTSSEMYRQAQEEEEEKLKEAKTRSPWAYTGGEIGATLLGASFLSGATAKTAAATRTGLGLGKEVALKQALKEGGKAGLGKELAKRAATGAIISAPVGAVSGAGLSEGKWIDSTPEEKEQLLKDVGYGIATGSALGAAIGILTPSSTVKSVKEIKKPSENELFRQLKTSFEEGQQGRGFTGVSQTAERLKQETGKATEITDLLLNARKKLGENIENTLDKAVKDGFTIEPGEKLISNASDIKSILSERPTLLGKTNTIKTLDEIDQLLAGNLDPKTANKMRDTFKDLAYELDDPELQLIAKRFSLDLKDELGKIPGFTKANELYNKFLAAGPESLLSKGLPVEYSNKYLSEVGIPEKELVTTSEKILKKMTNPGVSGETEKKTFHEFIGKLKEFESKNPGKLKELGIDVNQLREGMIKQADLSSIRKAIQGYEPQTNITDQWLNLITPRGGSMYMANVAGKASKAIKKPLEIGRNLYRATDNELQEIIIPQLRKIPGMNDTLNLLEQALANKDTAKKNALLFSILQKTGAREQLQDVTQE